MTQRNVTNIFDHPPITALHSITQHHTESHSTTQHHTAATRASHSAETSPHSMDIPTQHGHPAGTFGALISGCIVLPAAQFIPGPDCGQVISSALCSLLSALYPLLALCSLLSALCSLLSALCSLLTALCSLCSLLSALSHVSFLCAG
jgi:hypothetical protein